MPVIRFRGADGSHVDVDPLKEDDMIDVELEFPFSMLRLVVEKILTLPGALRPNRKSLGEDEAGTLIGDPDLFIQTFEFPSIGFYLKNSRALYDLRTSRNGTLVVHGFFNKIPRCLVEGILPHMATAHPIFGFACAPEERKRRNRATIRQNIGTIESWVGRDTQKYIPGLYWWTLLPVSFAQRHGFPLSKVASVALEHVELDGHQHLFRFYEKPEDWDTANALAELYSSLPGVFDVDKIRPALEATKTFWELNAIADKWP
jgi:hypothetical protein